MSAANEYSPCEEKSTIVDDLDGTIEFRGELLYVGFGIMSLAILCTLTALLRISTQ